MLNPNGSDSQPLPEEGQARTRTSAAAAVRHLDIDPSWRAGRKLQEARRQLGLSLEQISHRTKVRREFLEALEEMNAKLLPGKAYVLAYLRSYAKVLGLDEAAIVEQFQEECALSREDALPQIRSPESRPHPERPWLFAVALLAIAAGFVGWRALQDGQAPETAEAPPAVAAGKHETGAPGAPARQRQVEIRAIAESWIEVRGPDGTVFLSRTMQPGEVYQPDSSPGWTIHARDGGAFEIFVDGDPAGPLGAAGMPVLGRQIDTIEPLPAPVAPVTHPASARAQSVVPPAAPPAEPAPAAAPAAPPIPAG